MSKYGHLPVFLKPQCIIKTNNDGKLEADEDVLHQISKIEEWLVVVAIAGIYRTGKSFLMNRLANTNSGFPLGKTIESKTKGIWVWCRIHPTQGNTVLLLLDTEGLGDVKKGDINHDNIILSLSALLCNVLCYNILHAFDQDAVERLAFLSSGIGRQLDGISLVVCVRDFSLDLGHDSADAYLESCLKAIDGVGVKVVQSNRSRDSVKKCFVNRKCFTLDRPAGRNSIKRLDKITEAELNTDFVEDARKFERYIYERSTISASNDRTMNGLTFARFTSHHVKSISAGEVPEMHDALQKAYTPHNEQYVNTVTNSFKESVEKISLPVLDSKKFDMMCNSQLEKCLAELQQHVRYDDDKLYERQAKTEMQKVINERKQRNLQLVEAFCNDKLKALYSTLVGNEYKYNRIGGHVDYRSSITSFKAEFRRQCNEADYSLKELALQNFIQLKAQEESRIRVQDRRLTEEDANRKKEQIRLEHERQRQQSIRLNKERERAEEAMRERERREQEEFFRRKEQERLELMREMEEDNRRQRERWRREMRCLEEERQRDRENREAERRRTQEEARRRQEEIVRIQEKKQAEARQEQERQLQEELKRREEDREKREAERRRAQEEEKRKRKEIERLQERKRAEARQEQERQIRVLRRREEELPAFREFFITRKLIFCPFCGSFHYRYM